MQPCGGKVRGGAGTGARAEKGGRDGWRAAPRGAATSPGALSARAGACVGRTVGGCLKYGRRSWRPTARLRPALPPSLRRRRRPPHFLEEGTASPAAPRGRPCPVSGATAASASNLSQTMETRGKRGNPISTILVRFSFKPAPLDTACPTRRTRSSRSPRKNFSIRPCRTG